MIRFIATVTLLLVCNNLVYIFLTYYDKQTIHVIVIQFSLYTWVEAKVAPRVHVGAWHLADHGSTVAEHPALPPTH